MNRCLSYFLFCHICLLACAHVSAQSGTSLAGRLGYPAGTKLLIIHADDLGAAHTVDQASFSSLGDGPVNSASIMVPCPWLSEVAAFVKKQPGFDLGLHLTLTSEWQLYKWGPVSSRNAVSSLVDSSGYFYDDCDKMAAIARPEEVERELRAQIGHALDMGIQPSHFDTHMGCLYWTNLPLFKIYLKLGREYKVPLRLSRTMINALPESFQQAVTENDVVIDQIYSATPRDFQQGMAAFYEKVLHGLQPGVSEIVIHLAHDDAEMQGVAVDHPDWGAAWRQADFDFFNSDACRKILREENIRTITWREIGQLLR